MALNLLIVESPSKAKTLKKYLGKDKYPGRKAGEVRVTVTVTPEKIQSMG